MPTLSTELSEIRRTGCVMVLISIVFVAGGIGLHKPIPIVVFGMLSLIGMGFIILPGPLQWLHKGWLTVSRSIGKAITLILLGAVFFLVITPAAFIRRRWGGVPLPTKPDPHATTYWVARSEEIQPTEMYSKKY